MAMVVVKIVKRKKVLNNCHDTNQHETIRTSKLMKIKSRYFLPGT